ncbi:MAG: DUF2189 domain-containing protein [Paracoccaceae bacterium]
MTDANELLEPSPLPQIGDLTIGDILAALSAGWYDFKTAPAFGLFFSAVYVLGGFALLTLGAGTVAWTLTVSLGFPLVAPFAAVGLYEVSRRLEAGEPLIWRDILGVVVREKDRQIPWMGAIIVIYFLFWTFLAHMVFALFMGASALINVSSSVEFFLTPRGIAMMTTEMVLGSIIAFFLFSLTVVSLPLLLERELDFVTAMLLSFRTVQQNLLPMLLWAAIIAALTILAMLPLFLGLFVVLPVLGHATWHLYRRVLYEPV